MYVRMWYAFSTHVCTVTCDAGHANLQWSYSRKSLQNIKDGGTSCPHTFCLRHQRYHVVPGSYVWYVISSKLTLQQAHACEQISPHDN